MYHMEMAGGGWGGGERERKNKKFMRNSTLEAFSSSHPNNTFLLFRHPAKQRSSLANKPPTMSSSHFLAITTLVFLAFISCLPAVLLQSPSSPTSAIAQCSLRLLPLASCASFVQGPAPTPTQSCCDNLEQVYSQQPSCLCLLLNHTVMSAFPINRTLALQLPHACNLQVSIFPCSGFVEGMTEPPSSPDSQVSLGAGTNSTVAASPVVAAPRPRIVGFGFGQSSDVRLKVKNKLAVAVIGVTFLLTEVLI